MLRSNASRLHSLVQIADVAVAGAGFVLCLWTGDILGLLTGDGPVLRVLGLGLVATISWPLVLESLGLYESQRRVDFGRIAARMLLTGVICTGILAAAALALHAPVGLLFAIECGAVQTLAVGLLRVGIISGLRGARRLGMNYRNVLILGSGPRAAGVADLIRMHPEWGIRVSGFVDEADTPIAAALKGVRIHKIVDIPSVIRNEVVDEVIVATPRSMLAEITPPVAECAAAGIPVTVLSDLFGDYFPAPRAERLGGQPALSFCVVHHNRATLAAKRALDIAGAAVLMTLLAPVMLVIAAAVRWDSPGPVFFRQVRCGLYGRRFEILKFRTMCADAEMRRADLLHLNEMDGPVFKVAADPRITRIGRCLRRWSLDEVPQLWNVLRGDMSLVGPRPPIPEEVETYATFERRRLSMRPGLTCLWQVMGRNRIGFADWVKLDLEYIDSWSLTRDLTILMRTIPTVLRGTGS